MVFRAMPDPRDGRHHSCSGTRPSLNKRGHSPLNLMTHWLIQVLKNLNMVSVPVFSYNASGNPFRYTGRRLDAQWGVYYYRARYYDPQLGRFLETDPAGYVDSMNLYAYVGHDPLNATDPTGECITDGDGNAVSGVCGTNSGSQQVADQHIQDPKSSLGQLEALANAAGDIITFDVQPTLNTNDSDSWAPEPELRDEQGNVTVGESSGEMRIGTVPSTVPGTEVDGTGGPTIPFTVGDAIEHETSHLLDQYQGTATENATGVIDFSGAAVDVDRGGRQDGATEARAVNRTNLYRARTGSSFRRTRY